jgi:hypothetical protein
VVDRPCEHGGNKQFRQRGHDQFDFDRHEYHLDSDGKREHPDDIVNPDVHDVELNALHQQSIHDDRPNSLQPAFVELVNHANHHGLFVFESVHNIILNRQFVQYVQHTIFDLDTNFNELDTHHIELIDRLDGIDSRRLGLHGDADVLVE